MSLSFAIFIIFAVVGTILSIFFALLLYWKRSEQRLLEKLDAEHAELGKDIMKSIREGKV